MKVFLFKKLGITIKIEIFRHTPIKIINYNEIFNNILAVPLK